MAAVPRAVSLRRVTKPPGVPLEVAPGGFVARGLLVDVGLLFVFEVAVEGLVSPVVPLAVAHVLLLFRPAGCQLLG
jgi:hypothetical protein